MQDVVNMIWTKYQGFVFVVRNFTKVAFVSSATT